MNKKIILLLSSFLISFAAFAQPANWSDDVANIIYNKCSSCHHNGGIAPIELMSYTDAVAVAPDILTDISNRIMPPWPPDYTYQQYAHERLLTQTEIDTIVNWINGGTLSGNLSTAPAPPVFSVSSLIPSADLNLQIPTYTSMADMNDEYRCFVIPSGEITDKFMEKIEIIPGNGSIVHHVQIFTDIGTICYSLDTADALPGYESFGGTRDSSSLLVGTWVPGQGILQLPPGFGIRLPANSNLVLQLHYIMGSIGQLDSTKINIQYSAAVTPREIFLNNQLNNFTSSLIDGPIFIPNNTTRTYHERDTVDMDVSMFSTQPHMHYIGKKIKSFAVTPIGDTIPFVKIDNWEFHWQGQYHFQHPIKVPAGSVLYAEAFYDNTPSNPEYPVTTQNIIAGYESTDEMMVVAFNYALYQSGDEDIIIDSTSIINGIGSQQAAKKTITVFPNPAIQFVHVFSPDQHTALETEIFNMLGESVIGKQKKSPIDISILSDGIYFIQIRQGDQIHTEKIVKQ